MTLRSAADIRSRWQRRALWRLGALLAALATTACVEGDLVQLAQPGAQRGQITGDLCYPSDWIPAMTVYARNLSLGQTFRTQRPAGSDDYALSVPPGRYVVYSWSDPRSSGADAFGQGYTDTAGCDSLARAAAVECRRQAKLAPVLVGPGARVGSIDLCDYPQAIPPP